MKRITDENGNRIYQTPDGNFPSVTTILSASDSPANRARLDKWRENNPGKLEEAQKRGSTTHAAIERWLAGYTHLTEEESEYTPYIENAKLAMERVGLLRSSTEIVWSEKPLCDLGTCDRKYFFGSDGIPRVWSNLYKFAGCPDIIANINGSYRIIDLKTSDVLYRATSPNRKQLDEREYLAQFRGWQKFMKCAHQLAAYTLAIEEMTGLNIEKMIIVSSTSMDYNTITLYEQDIDKYKSKFIEKVSKFYADTGGEARLACQHIPAKCQESPWL